MTNSTVVLVEGIRVGIAPHTDSWARGDRYGVITLVGTKWVHVRMDRSGRTKTFLPSQLVSIW